jgi:hypothetical protein
MIKSMAEAKRVELQRTNSIIFEQVAELDVQNSEQLSMFMEQLHFKGLELDNLAQERDQQMAMSRELEEQVEQFHIELAHIQDQNHRLTLTSLSFYE